MRRLELWGEYSISEFAEEFVSNTSWDQPGIRFSGVVEESQSVVGRMGGSAAFYNQIFSLRPSMMLMFHEDISDREASGHQGLDAVFARLCAGLSQNKRVTHGVLAESNPSLCLFTWSPEERTVIDMDLRGMEPNERSYAEFRDARAVEHFQSQLRTELYLRGLDHRRRSLRWDWENR